MSGHSSPAGDAGGGGAAEAASLRLSVRKDLFPEAGSEATAAPRSSTVDDLDVVSCVNLETDFEQSIDEIARSKSGMPNGVPEKRHRSSKKRKRKKRSSSAEDQSDDSSYILENGLSTEQPRRSPRDTRSAQDRTKVTQSVKGGKNLSLVSSSERVHTRATPLQDEGESDVDSDDEVLKCSVPVLRLPLASAGGGKPYSHSLSQLSNKKRKAERAPALHVSASAPSGKPRSMLDIVSSRTKKKSNSKKVHLGTTYHSQIVDTDAIKIKIRKGNIKPQDQPPAISVVPQRKSKKKKITPRVESESSGEEYDPSHGDTAASISVAAPKPRNQPARTRKEITSKSKEKRPVETSSKPTRVDRSSSSGPQSQWGSTVPITVLTKIFEYVIATQGTLPTVIRLGRVCKLWHSVAFQPVLWRHVELAPYTRDQSKTDFKLISMLENRLPMCHTLNLAHWKVSNIPCVMACLAEYCPLLEELNLTGWTRLTAEHLLELVQGNTKLKRLDLSLTSEMAGSGTCLSASSMLQFTETVGSRLTHLSLANNMFTALQQILTYIAMHCSSLEVLDISGARATSHPALIPLEVLQKGCPKLRVLRAANAQVVLATATTQQKMEAGGFPCLEELSIAAGTGGSGVGEYRLDDDALERIVRGATRLRLLDLRGLTRISDSGLVRVPAWDLQHLFLGLCKVTQQSSSCLELVCEKWAHSLLEVDLAWASATRPLDAAVEALADKGAESKLRVLNLCGSSVSFEPVKKVLVKCERLESINLSSCRALPRGMKRLYTGKELEDLKNSLDPARIKAKKEEDEKANKEMDAKHEVSQSVPERESESSQASSTPVPTPSSVDRTDISPPQTDQPRPPEPSTKSTVVIPSPNKNINRSPANKIESMPKDAADNNSLSNVGCSPSTPGRNWNLEQFSPSMQTNADSSSSNIPENRRVQSTTQESPISKPNTQIPLKNSPELQETSTGSSLWNLEQFKTTPTHKSEASPLSKIDSHTKTKRCSPVTTLDCKPSPEAMHNVKQDIKNPNHWNYGNYSSMPRPDGQYSSHNSPYSAQPSPAQPSPYSAQPSPYSTQPSPYSSQQSPYSQPSPDTSQIAKPDHPKSSGNWNVGGYSPMTKPPSQYSPHPSTHTSPDPGGGIKPDGTRSNPGKAGQFSPISRGLSHERHHRSPYSPRPSIESPAGIYPNRKSPGMGNYSPMMRLDAHIPSPDSVVTSRAPHTTRQLDTRVAPAPADPSSMLSNADLTAAAWAALDGFLPGPGSRGSMDATWLTPGFQSGCATRGASGAVSAQDWCGVPGFDTMLNDFPVDPAPVNNSFLDQNLTFESLAHATHQFVDESYAESRVD